MKKILLLFVFFLFCANLVKAQTYTLTRGLPVAEIAGTGTAITGLAYNNPVGPLNIGFSFNFTGTAYTQFYLGPHGIITFGSGSTASNLFIPSTSFGKDVIAFACVYQFPETGSPILNYFTSGTSPNRILVLNYKNVQQYGNSSNITSVQVQLYENNGKIEIHNTLNAATVGSGRTIGIQNASGNEGYTSTALNSTSTLSANNEMIRFSLPPPCSHSVSITSTSISICDGQSINLTPTITPSGTYTYQWLKDNVTIAGSTSATYAAITPGTYKIRVTNSSNCESFSNKITITKPFIPTIPSSSWGTCQSQTASVSPSGTYTYQWFKSNTAISGATSSAFRPSTTGYYKVRATNSGGCSITSDSVIVRQNGVIANSTLTGYTCSNRSLGAYTGYFIGTESYLWTGPNNFTSTAQYPNLTNLTTGQQGTYTVVATVPGCSSFTANTELTVQPIALNPSNLTGYVCGSVQLNPNISTTPSNTTTYLWTGPDAFTSSQQYPSVSNLTTAKQGNYTIQVTIAGCATLTAVSSVTVLQNTGSIGFYGNQQCSTTVLQYNSIFGTVTPSAYLWTGPNSFSSTLSSPQIANPTLSNSGVYTLRVTYSTCGTTTLTSQVTVEPYFISSTSGDNTRYNLCSGQTVNLSASANLFSGTTYSWSGPSGFTSSVSSPSITLTPNRVGTYIVTAMIAGCATATATTVVNTANISVSARVNGDLHCPSNRVDLSSTINNSSAFDAPPSPTVISYQWTGPNGFNSSLKNPILTNVSTSNSGLYTLNAIISGGCVATNTSVVALNVRNNPEMTVFGGGTFCSGETTVIRAYTYNNLGNGTTTASYQWTGPNGFSSTEKEVYNVPVGMGGVYTVSATFNNGCTGTYTNLVHIFSRRKPPLSTTNASACLGSSQQISSLSDFTSINSFSWTGPDSFSSTLQSPVIANITNAKLGVYTVTLAKTGCPETSSATLTVSLSTACNVVSSCYAGAFAFGNNSCPGSDVIIRLAGCCGVFYDAGIGATSVSFSWSGPNGFTATGNEARITNVTSSGTYIQTMNVVGGTCNGVYTNQIAVTVKPPTNTPTFSGTVSRSLMCEDEDFYFLNSVNGGSVKQYTLTGPNGLLHYGNSSSPNFYSNKPSQSGTYTVSGIMNGECQSSTTDFPFSQSYNITISPRPSAPSISASSTNVQAGQSVTLTGSNCGNQINWSLGSYIGTTYNYTTANPFIDTPPVATTYWAICRSSEGCLSPSSNRIAVSLGICTNMQSIQSGLWTNPSVWSCGSVPTSANITTISAGHTVTIPASTSAFVRNLLNYGTLGYGQNASLRIGQ